MSERRMPGFREAPARHVAFGTLGQVCRLGLASRGNTHLDAESVRLAIDRGINYLNWCGHADGMSEAIRSLGPRRGEVLVAAQFEARTAAAARRELAQTLADLNTTYLDVLTYYYVEHLDEWRQILAPGGAAEVLESARRQGIVRAIGATSHQRALAAQMAQSERLDMLMVRYNAAHRGAEEQVFPVCQSRGLPVVTFTGLRWGALVSATPDDPPGFELPAAAEWYRFVLCHPGVTVGLMAPNDREELLANLKLLDDWRGLDQETYEALLAHGDRVRRHAGQFP